MFKNLKLLIISSIIILAFSSSVYSETTVYSGTIEKKTKEGMNTKTILVTVLGTVAGAGIYFLSGDQDNSENENTRPTLATKENDTPNTTASKIRSFVSDKFNTSYNAAGYYLSSAGEYLSSGAKTSYNAAGNAYNYLSSGAKTLAKATSYISNFITSLQGYATAMTISTSGACYHIHQLKQKLLATKTPIIFNRTT